MNTDKKYVNKDEYVIRMGGVFMNPELFSACESTQLPVETKNGEAMAMSGGWIETQAFPNPCATVMLREYAALEPHMGVTARTIINYLDKDTNQPVATMFPSNVHVHDGYEDDYMKHLNFATREDFKREQAKREEALARVKIAHQY